LNDFPDVPNDSNAENTNVNDYLEEKNELGMIKDELLEEFGTDKDIPSLVELRKAEMNHDLEMERLDLERSQLTHEQRLNEKQLNAERLKERLNETETKLEKERQEKERLGSVAQELKEEKEHLQNVVEELTEEKEVIELDDDLKDEFLECINDYLELEDDEITCEIVEDVLENTKSINKKITKWCKKQNLDKSDYPEIETLKNIKESLVEMLDEFEIQNEDELIFEFDSEFDEQLKEKYS
jgi:hypothetical protein